jgi:hypothetical protein
MDCFVALLLAMTEPAFSDSNFKTAISKARHPEVRALAARLRR